MTLVARCPHCMAPMSGRFSICETCGRIVSGASGLQSRISRSTNIGAVPTTHRARKGPPPGAAMGGRTPPPVPSEIRRRQQASSIQRSGETPRRLIRRNKERRNTRSVRHIHLKQVQVQVPRISCINYQFQELNERLLVLIL